MDEPQNKDEVFKLLKQLVTDQAKPKGWSNKSVSPYYNEKSAAQIKYVFDEMMADTKKESRCFYFKDFPGVSKDTLYSKINQGIRYLIENLDADEKYRKFYDSKIQIRTKSGFGIIFEFLLDDAINLVAKPLVPIEKKAEWRMKIDEFMLTAEKGNKLDLTKLRLTDEDVKTIEESHYTMDKPDDWLFVIKNDRVIIARIN